MADAARSRQGRSPGHTLLREVLARSSSHSSPRSPRTSRPLSLRKNAAAASLSAAAASVSSPLSLPLTRRASRHAEQSANSQQSVVERLFSTPASSSTGRRRSRDRQAAAGDDESRPTETASCNESIAIGDVVLRRRPLESHFAAIVRSNTGVGSLADSCRSPLSSDSSTISSSSGSQSTDDELEDHGIIQRSQANSGDGGADVDAKLASIENLENAASGVENTASFDRGHWKQHMDAASGRPYFYDRISRRVTWTEHEISPVAARFLNGHRETGRKDVGHRAEKTQEKVGADQAITEGANRRVHFAISNPECSDPDNGDDSGRDSALNSLNPAAHTAAGAGTPKKPARMKSLITTRVDFDVDEKSPSTKWRHSRSPDYEAAVVELVETERRYVHMLEILVDEFYLPLRDIIAHPDFQKRIQELHPNAPINSLHTKRIRPLGRKYKSMRVGSHSGSRILALFGEGERLLALHRKILRGLEASPDRYFTVFLQHQEQLIEYHRYTTLIGDATEEIAAAMGYPPFAQHCTQVERNLNDTCTATGASHFSRDISSVIICPLQRIVRYQLLISQILRGIQLPPHSPARKVHFHEGDRALVALGHAALAIVKDAAKRCNDAELEAKQAHRIAQLLNQGSGSGTSQLDGQTLPPTNPHRRLLQLGYHPLLRSPLQPLRVDYLSTVIVFDDIIAWSVGVSSVEIGFEQDFTDGHRGRRFTDGSLLDGDGKQRLDARLRAGTWDSSARPVENSSRSAWQGHPLFGRYYQYPRTCGGCHTFRFEGTFEGLEWFFFFNEEEERWHVGPTIGDDEKILVYDGPCNNGMPTPGGQWFCFDSGGSRWVPFRGCTCRVHFAFHGDEECSLISLARLPVNAKIVGSVRSLTQSENPDQSVSEGAASGGGGGSVAETKRLEQHERGDSGPDLGQVVVCIRQRAEDVVFFAREENWQRTHLNHGFHVLCSDREQARELVTTIQSANKSFVASPPSQNIDRTFRRWKHRIEWNRLRAHDSASYAQRMSPAYLFRALKTAAGPAPPPLPPASLRICHCDTYKILKRGQLRKEPSTASATTGNAYEVGEVHRARSIATADGRRWVKFDDGWFPVLSRKQLIGRRKVLWVPDSQLPNFSF